ncbi:hypothetical protein K9U39_00685 [Rhodoblastus acidophilus]|uniref:Glycosyltransferase RgtA/B/C/D-like domain-containing protein n=1 Tax=Candidatus Rhodoblastus alkanivorans TaxID=2954117 RepID=A0ABS9Z3H6_9HYPH|nr:hypothetical protein [Candidatus Rhodoblastus alkanivorans]MCI4678784.1 hypothetical protein [Candidatus Rhodoblastus alkanivorans]MCI4682173.1 hypothetical protein [Candidatus Rhodoblastus alkanivorans]MDI4639475.1 hypothetical protein [Rhodoblastus acidophilus]
MTDSALVNHSQARSRDSALPRRLILPPLAKAPAADWPLAALAALGCFALLLPTAPSLLADGDMFWHIRTGQEILATGHFPTVDAYSWSMTGHPWIAKEWLSQVLYALAFNLAGWTGAALLALAAASAAYAMVFAAVERRAGAAFALASVLVIAMAGNFHLLVRPHVLAWPVMVLFASQLLDAAEEGRAPRLRSALLITLWANLHGSFLLGFIILPFFAWESLARTTAPRGPLALRWLVFAALCVGAALIHPYGWGVLIAAREVLTLGPAMSLIAEWRPQNFAGFGHFELILLLGLGAALLTGLRLPAPRLALLLALLHSMLAHVRQETLGLMIIALLLGAPVAALRGVVRLPREKRSLAAFTVVATAIVTGGMALKNFPLTLPEATAPRAALAAARAAGVKGNVLNDDHFGGYLISRYVPTYVDGRAEMYGMMHYDLSMAIGGRMPDKLAALLADPKIGWTLLPSVMPANRTLAASPDWRLVYRDPVATVYARVR